MVLAGVGLWLVCSVVLALLIGRIARFSAKQVPPDPDGEFGPEPASTIRGQEGAGRVG